MNGMLEGSRVDSDNATRKAGRDQQCTGRRTIRTLSSWFYPVPL